MRHIEPEKERDVLTLQPIRSNEKPPRIRVLWREKIGGGDYGEVFQIGVSKFFPRDSQDDYMEQVMVSKVFGNREVAERAYANIMKLREAGFPVPTTVRLAQETNELIMTDESRAGSVFVSAAPQSKLARQFRIDFTDDQITWLAQNIYKWARHAADQGIFLSSDAYFMQIIPEGPLSPHGKTVQIVFCDSDRVKKIPTHQLEEPTQVQELLAKNIGRATVAIQAFIASYNNNDRKPHDLDVQAIIRKARTSG